MNRDKALQKLVDELKEWPLSDAAHYWSPSDWEWRMDSRGVYLRRFAYKPI